MTTQDHILVVDDDREIRELLADYLQKQGMRCSAVENGRRMQAAIESAQIDLIVLDLMLPGEDGLTLCRNLRSRSNIPILMLTARGDDMDRILGLEMGADDYLAKPFVPRELYARIRSILRRARALPARGGEAEGRLAGFAGWRLDPLARRLVDSDGLEVSLSGAEYRLLRVFVEHPQRVLSRGQLLDLTQGREADPFDRSIDLLVSRLRQRLREDAREPAILKTVRNEGYVLAARVEWGA
jgi:two-component system OmpR family response regulator